MAVEIKMPKLGQTTDEVHLVRWHVKEGDTVAKGQPLCEAENDKTTMDVESYAAGTVLRLAVEPDSTVAAGTVIAVLGEPGEEVSAGVSAETPQERRDAAPAAKAVSAPAAAAPTPAAAATDTAAAALGPLPAGVGLFDGAGEG